MSNPPLQSNNTIAPPSGTPVTNPALLQTITPSVGVGAKPKFTEEPSLPKIGFHLSKFVLFIMSGFILLLILILFIKQFDATDNIIVPTNPNISDSTYSQKIAFAKIIIDEKINYRNFILQISQIVLLNLLLPILTAILGYIFASNKNKE